MCNFGGLPNYTFEILKSIPLDTMFRNGVEAISGICVFQNVVQTPEFQSKEKVSGRIVINSKWFPDPNTYC